MAGLVDKPGEDSPEAGAALDNLPNKCEALGSSHSATD